MPATTSARSGLRVLPAPASARCWPRSDADGVRVRKAAGEARRGLPVDKIARVHFSAAAGTAEQRRAGRKSPWRKTTGSRINRKNVPGFGSILAAARQAAVGSANIAFIVLDDVGYSELGSLRICIDAEDRCVWRRTASGNTKFHVTSMCSPTRALPADRPQCIGGHGDHRRMVQRVSGVSGKNVRARQRRSPKAILGITPDAPTPSENGI